MAITKSLVKLMGGQISLQTEYCQNLFIHPLATAIPIIAMKADAFSEDIHDWLESGRNAHISKPIDMIGF